MMLGKDEKTGMLRTRGGRRGVARYFSFSMHDRKWMRRTCEGGVARSFGRHDHKHLHLATACNGNLDLKISHTTRL